MSLHKESESYKIYLAVCKRCDQLDLLLQSGIIKDDQKEQQIREVLNELTDVSIMMLNGGPYSISIFKDWANVSDLNKEE